MTKDGKGKDASSGYKAKKPAKKKPAASAADNDISKNYCNRYKNVFKYPSYILCTDDLTMWLKTYPSRVAIYAVKA